MKAILRVVKAKLLKQAYEILEEHMKTNYNAKSCVCVIEESDGKLYFSTKHTQGLCSVSEAKRIRAQVGQNILMRWGIPQGEEDVPYVRLVILPSAVKLLGFKDALNFVRDWRGDSRVGELVVIRYIA